MEKLMANGINYYRINLSQFKEDMNCVLDYYIGAGQESMDCCDFANEIGFVIESNSLSEAKEIYEEFCSGLHHGVGLDHNKFNERKDIDERLAVLKSKLKNNRQMTR